MQTVISIKKSDKKIKIFTVTNLISRANNLHTCQESYHSFPTSNITLKRSLNILSDKKPIHCFMRSVACAKHFTEKSISVNREPEERECVLLKRQ